MTVIWKYHLHQIGSPIPNHGTVVKVSVPAGSEPLSFGVDPDGSLVVWFDVEDPQAEQKLTHKFVLCWTGRPYRLPRQCGKFMGTFVADGLVWHVYWKQ